MEHHYQMIQNAPNINITVRHNFPTDIMGHSGWLLMSTLAVLLVLVNTSQLGCIVLDLSKVDFDPPIKVVHGTFRNGGIYTFLDTESVHPQAIVFGKHLVDIPSNQATRPGHMKIHIYMKYGKPMIGITYMYTRSKVKWRTKFLVFSEGEYKLAPMQYKFLFVNGPISVPYDFDDMECHPFIKKSRIRPYANGTMLSSSKYRYVKKRLVIHRLPTLLNDEIIISPFTWINKSFNSIGKKVSISSHSQKIFVPESGGYIYLYFGYQGRSRHTVNIPPIVDGIFNRRSIMGYTYKFSTLGDKSPGSFLLKIVIDISKTTHDLSEVVILYNLAMGDWIYTQYVLIEKLYSIHLTVRVVNSALNCTIYETGENEFISHVETFINRKQGCQFIVVNLLKIQKRGENFSINYGISKIFNVIYHENDIIYYDLSKYWIDPYMEMLNNIAIAPKFAKPDDIGILMNRLMRNT
ncbi:uncharacterized protein BBOV_IV003530 [Babesia bovis T2Bo]|uniref:Uncharacterized protein n=1 Tax=Babesia bovis TaxID=5865 RepID=A7AVX3_BABBO|nr:uncharacterized protein BBOV_IV003530 [Babesia bovis T2Bo]EDO05949.1 hypothetical protein BBOV_IV003530 [Babesia bovis T2Bo]|eukprot:XP_001609517.1 hypothetical protein [Babesia bovis T2Bo]